MSLYILSLMEIIKLVKIYKRNYKIERKNYWIRCKNHKNSDIYGKFHSIKKGAVKVVCYK